MRLRLSTFWRKASAVAAGFGVLLFSLSPSGAASPCQRLGTADMQDIHERLVAGLARRAVTDVVALYTHDAIVMPMHGPSVLIGRADIRRHIAALVRRGTSIVYVSGEVTSHCGRAEVVGEAFEIAGSPAADRGATRLSYSMHLVHQARAWRIVHHTMTSLGPAAVEPEAAVVSTSAVPRGTGVIVLPPVPYRLPNSPPVIVAPNLPYMLTPSGAGPRQLRSNAIPVPTPPSVVASPPAPPIAAPMPIALPPLPVATLPPTLGARPPVAQPHAVAVVVPDLPFRAADLPPALLPRSPPIPITEASTLRSVAPAKRPPAVASFARRTPAKRPRRASVGAPEPLTPAYRTGRFVDGNPTFD